MPRYYITIVALSYAGWLRHELTPLWTARISVPYWGCYLDEAVPAMIRAGSPMFGRDMTEPKMVEISLVPKGRVEVGIANAKELRTARPAVRVAWLAALRWAAILLAGPRACRQCPGRDRPRPECRRSDR